MAKFYRFAGLIFLIFSTLVLFFRPSQIHAKTLAFRTPGAKLVAVSDIFEEAGARVVEGCNGMPKFYKVCMNSYSARINIIYKILLCSLLLNLDHGIRVLCETFETLGFV